MKIAFVSQPFDRVIPPDQGSVGICTYQIARRLSRSNEVIIYVNSKKGSAPALGPEKIYYRYAQLASQRTFQWMNARLFRWFNKRIRVDSLDLVSLVYILEVARDLQKQKCDVIHIQNYSQFVPIIRALNPRTCIVLHMHCEWLTQFDPGVVAERLTKADLILGASDHITSKIRLLFPQFAAKCKTVYNGVDVEYFTGGQREQSNDHSFKLLFVGRVSPEKGVHDLIAAFRQVMDCYPDTQLHIIGWRRPLPMGYLVALSDDAEVADLASFYRVNYLDYLRKQIAAGLDGKVFFHDHLPQAQMLHYYRQADIVVNPSYSEAFGMSLVEAMASEVPVVATRVGGMVEIVKEGKTGLLVNRGDPQALAHAILTLLDNADLRRSMGKMGRKRAAERFSWDLVASKIHEFYELLVQDSLARI